MTMNHHADKLAYTGEDGEFELLMRLYRCPGCGAGDAVESSFPLQ